VPSINGSAMSEAAMYLLELSLVFAVGKFVNLVLLSRIVVAWWRSGESVGFAAQKVAGLIPSLALSGNSLQKVECSHTCLHHQAV